MFWALNINQYNIPIIYLKFNLIIYLYFYKEINSIFLI